MKCFKVNAFLFTIIIALCSCSETGITELDEIPDNVPEIELVRLEGSLNKTHSTSDNTINFSEIPATTSQYYLLLNKGERDAFDINFSGDHILIKPTHIDILTSEGSGNIESLPIVEITALHVVPPYGVGELLPFEIGAIADTAILDYKFLTMAGDTSIIDKKYYIEGAKVGAMVSLNADGIDLVNAAAWMGGDTDDPQEGFRNLSLEVDNLGVSSLNSVFVVNHGNVSITVEIWGWEDRFYGRQPLGVHTVVPGDSVDIEDYPNSLYPGEGHLYNNYLVLHCGQNILSFADQSYLNGALGISLVIRS